MKREKKHILLVGGIGVLAIAIVLGVADQYGLLSFGRAQLGFNIDTDVACYYDTTVCSGGVCSPGAREEVACDNPQCNGPDCLTIKNLRFHTDPVDQGSFTPVTLSWATAPECFTPGKPLGLYFRLSSRNIADITINSTELGYPERAGVFKTSNPTHDSFREGENSQQYGSDAVGWQGPYRINGTAGYTQFSSVIVPTVPAYEGATFIAGFIANYQYKTSKLIARTRVSVPVCGFEAAKESPTPTPTSIPTNTPTPTVTPTSTPTPTLIPTITPTLTPTPKENSDKGTPTPTPITIENLLSKKELDSSSDEGGFVSSVKQFFGISSGQEDQVVAITPTPVPAVSSLVTTQPTPITVVVDNGESGAGVVRKTLQIISNSFMSIVDFFQNWQGKAAQ